MKFAATSTTALAPIMERKERGAKLISLYIREEDVSTLSMAHFNLKECGVHPVVIHAPESPVCSVEGIISKKGYFMADKICSFANSAAQDGPVHVVFRQELGMERLKGWGLLEFIEEACRVLLETYPNISINFQNVNAISSHSEHLEMHQNHRFDSVELALYLRHVLGTDRIGASWDFAQALRSMRQIHVFSELGICKGLGLRDYAERYLPVMKVMTLANVRGFSTDKNGGEEFTGVEEVAMLEEVIAWLSKSDYGGILALDVGERSASNAEGFQRTFEKIYGVLT